MRSDNNVYSIAGQHGTAEAPLVFHVPNLRAQRDENGRIISHDTLKLSGCSYIIVQVDEVESGIEDVADFNNKCRNVTVRIGRAVVRGRFATTIKGGCESIALFIGQLCGRGSEMDVDFGNRSDQSDNPTKGCSVHIESTDDSRPIRWRSLNARDCTVTGGPGVRIKKAFALPSWLGSVVQKVWDIFAGK